MKNFLLLAIFLLFVNTNVTYTQDTKFSKYAIALSEITTFADTPGFKNKISVEPTDSKVKWLQTEDGFIFTEDLDNIITFGYKVLYETHENLIIEVFYDSVGSATFSYLFDVSTNEDNLILNKVIAGGDRCHFGLNLDEIQINETTLSYQTFVTSQNLMILFSEQTTNLDLTNCMVCCIGFLNVDYDLSKKKKTLKNVLIIKEALLPNSPFDRAYNEFVKDKNLKLSLTLDKVELKKFLDLVLKESA